MKLMIGNPTNDRENKLDSESYEDIFRGVSSRTTLVREEISRGFASYEVIIAGFCLYEINNVVKCTFRGHSLLGSINQSMNQHQMLSG